jgi:hypothetical protein
VLVVPNHLSAQDLMVILKSIVLLCVGGTVMWIYQQMFKRVGLGWVLALKVGMGF